MSRMLLGPALLVLLASGQAFALEDGCAVESLAASKSYVNCLTRHEIEAIRHDAESDHARCDALLERKLTRGDCGSAADAAALAIRLQAALAAPEVSDAEIVAAYSPLIMAVVAEPNPVLGSDGRTHLVYEVQLTNASGLPWPIATIEVLDGADPSQVLLAIEGEDVVAALRVLGGGTGPATLAPGQSGLLFIHVPLEADMDVPAALVHRLTLPLPDGVADGFRVFAGLSAEAEVLEETGAATTVADRAPVELGPPLRGGRWIAADGCCVAPLHVRALQLVNGDFKGAQRFAIDWEMVNEDGRIYVGDRHELASYFAYGQEALAVADARVARVFDGMAEEVPGALPTSIALADADGNHVILDLGGGRYVLYAHFIPGSIRVAEGDQVRRGEVLGLVGNSGNTLVPHLHLHVMSAPSGLASNGLPYVFDGYELLGRVPSTETFNEAEASGEPIAIVPVDTPGAHAGDLSLDQSIVRFPG